MLDGLSSSSGGTKSGDGGTVGGDPTPPPGADGGHSDDGSVVGEGGVPSLDFCAGATFCDQFERMVAKGAWDETYVVSGGQVLVTNARARSFKGSLRSTVPAGTGAAAALTKTMSSARKVRLTFASFVDVAPSGSLDVASVRFRYGDLERRIYLLYADSGFVNVSEDDSSGGFFTNHAGTQLVTNRWVESSISIDVGVTPARITVIYDGKQILDNAALALTYSPSAPTIVAGVLWSNGVPQTQFDIDDVRVDITP
jgi:hypothetical protein